MRGLGTRRRISLARRARPIVRASAIPTAMITRVSVIAAPETWWLAIQVVSEWLNQWTAPIEKQLRAAMWRYR
jgi:hypothetical protein